MKQLTAFFSIIFLMACSTPKLAEQKQQTVPEGYTKVIVEDARKGGCGFLLQISETNQYLRPQSLPEEFQQHHTVCYVKFRPTKPLQRKCTKGKPVILEDVLK